MIRSEVRPADASAIRKAFSHFPSGVAVLAAEIRGTKHAIVASSFMVGVSLTPTLVAVAIQKASETWAALKDARQVGVSILGHAQGGLTRKLAGKDREARFDEVAISGGDDGAIFIEDAALWLDCTIHRTDEAGDHWMVLLEVAQLGVGATDPLIWHGSTFRELATVDAVTHA